MLILDPQTVEQFCSNSGVQTVFRILGVGITAIKIAIPIILILWGMLDMGKAVTSGQDDEIKKQLVKFLKRAIAAILVFFIPSIVGLLMQMINNNASDVDACGYDRCVQPLTGVGGKCTG